MELIAQERACPWNEEVEGDFEFLLCAEMTVPRESMADIFYAQMNGVALDAPEPAHPEKPKRRKERPMRDLEIRSAHSRSTIASKSTASLSSGDDTLSMDEIQEYVMEHIPAEIKDKIPKEAWSQIFGSSRADITFKPSLADSRLPDPEDDEDDDSVASFASEISDITEHTEFVKRSSNTLSSSSRAPMAPEEEKEDIDICPTLLPENSMHTRGSSKALTRNLSIDASILASSETQQSKSSGVTFSHVQVRYYERILDINPAVTNGAALGIGWRYKRGGMIEMDEWESRKTTFKRPNDLLLSRHVREGMLKDIGYDKKDIAAATRIILKAKNQRKATVQNLGAQGMEEAIESAARRVKAVLSFGRKKGLVKK